MLKNIINLTAINLKSVLTGRNVLFKLIRDKWLTIWLIPPVFELPYEGKLTCGWQAVLESKNNFIVAAVSYIPGT